MIRPPSDATLPMVTGDVEPSEPLSVSLWSAGQLGRGRFDVGEEIGRGAFGIVYRARDRLAGVDVAMKVLYRDGSDGTFGIKREFRVLRGLAHPSLVRLYELFADAQPNAFTMELVEGTDVLRWARPVGDGCDYGRLCTATAQIADGLAYLHRCGFVHGDVKPSNVRVARDGRVALCDFGLTGRFAGAYGVQAARGRRGTLLYMAPELFEADRATPAADWFALGVLLYEAVTGRRPFPGPVPEMRAAKHSGAIERPTATGAILPDGLEALILALLDPDPTRRPGAAEVHDACGEVEANGHGFPIAPVSAPRLVGRAAEIDRIAAAWAMATEAPVVVEVSGPSGIGKSAVAQTFADTVAGDGALVLPGACHLAEHVRYNALDGVVDALSRHLLESDDGWPAMLDEDTESLVSLFPVLGRVAPLPAEPTPFSLAEQRRRGSAALGALLASIAEHRRVLVWIEDVQWADADSLGLLRSLVSGRAPVMFLLTRRAEEGVTAAGWESSGRTHVESIVLAALAATASAELVAMIAPGIGDALGPGVEASAGIPFLLCEVARGWNTFGAAAATSPTRALEARIAQLGEGPRDVLQICAVAGHPIDRTLAVAAAGIESRGRAILGALEDACLVRSLGAGSVAPYHDRVRLAVTGGLGPAQVRQLHLAIAKAALDHGMLDPELLAQHLALGGERRRAATYALAAGRSAMESLAFDAADRFLTFALELGIEGEPPWSLLRERAAARGLAGKGARAAEGFDEAANALEGAGGDPSLVIDLRRHAAEQWLRVGQVATGLDRLRVAVASAGLTYPPGRWSALGTVLTARVWRQVAGFTPSPPPPGGGTPAELARIDTAWTATLGLNMIDILRSAAFQAIHTRLALNLGEPVRVARALTLEMVYLACEGGPRNRARSQVLQTDAEALAERTGDADIIAFVRLCGGAAAVFTGRFREGLGRLVVAERSFRSRNMGAVLEMVNCGMYRSWALVALGELRMLAAMTPEVADDARDRGDVLAESALSSGPANLAWLAVDRPDEARERAAHAVLAFPADDFQSPHYFDLVAQVQIDLYEGDGPAAWNRIRAAWPKLEAVFFLRLQYFRIELLALRARAALAAARSGAPGWTSAALLADADDSIDRLATEAHDVGPAIATVLRLARRSLGEVHVDSAFAAAAPMLDAHGLGLYAMAARHRSGLGAEGSGWNVQRVIAPDRLTAMMLP